MTDIPEARRLLKLALTDLRGAVRAVKKAHSLMTRPPPVRRAKSNSKHVTPEMAAQIRECAANYPNESFRQLAKRFNVDAGRVSEAMRHLR